MALPHFYFVFLAINFALNSEMSSATRRSMRASFLNKAEHLQSYVRNNSSSSGLRNGKDVTTEKHAFFALIPRQMRSPSDDRVLPARKKLSRRSRSPLSTSLSNFRREWILEQTGQVLVGKTKREVPAFSKLLIDYDGLNRHTESYRQKLFGPHAVKPSLSPLPLSFTGLPRPLPRHRSADRRSSLSLPGPSSREHYYQASLALVAGKSAQGKDQLFERKQAPLAHHKQAPLVRVPGKPAQGKDQLSEHKQVPLAHHKQAPLALMAGEPSKGKDQLLENNQNQAFLALVLGKPAQGKDQLSEHKQAPLAQHKQAPLALMAGEASKGKDQLLENNHNQAFLALVTGKPAQGKRNFLLWVEHVAPSTTQSQTVTTGNVNRSRFVLPSVNNAGLGIGNLSQQENTGKVIFSDRKNQEQESFDSQRIIGDGFQDHYRRKKNRARDPSDNRRASWGNVHNQNSAKKNKAQQPHSDNQRTRREDFQYKNRRKNNFKQNSFDSKQISWDGVQDQNRHMKKYEQQSFLDNLRTRRDDFQDQNKRKKNQAQESSLDVQIIRKDDLEESSESKQISQPHSDNQRTRREDFQYKNRRKNNFKQNSFDSKQISWDGVQDQNRQKKKYDQIIRRDDFQDQNNRKKNQARESSSARKMIPWDDFQHQTSSLKKNHAHPSSSGNRRTHSKQFPDQISHEKNPAHSFPDRFPLESSKNQSGASVQDPWDIPRLDARAHNSLTNLRKKRGKEMSAMENINDIKRQLSMKDDLVCLGMLIAGHKYFGFDPRKGNEVTWRYRKMGFYASFPRPRLKKLHPDAVEACKDDAVRCIRKVSALARRSSILQGTVCLKKTFSRIDRPPDAGPYYPFDSALDLFRYRTSVSYFMCWHAIKRNEALKKMWSEKSCLQALELNTLHEPFDNQKSILDFRDDKVEFQCAMLAFCPDPCYGRKTKGIVPDKAFVAGRDPGNPCRGLRDQTCGWNFPQNIQFEDLQRNRFNISCNCEMEKPGFAWNSKYHLCVDVDECLKESIRTACGRAGNMRCQNIVGGFRCVCQPGFLRNQETRLCEEHVKIPRPVFNHSLTNARHLQKMLQSEGSGTFLWKEIEAALGLSSSSQHYPGMLWLLCNIIIVCFHLGNAVW